VASTLPQGRRPRSKAGGRSTLGTSDFSLSDADTARIEAEACRRPKDVGIPVTHGSASLLGAHVRAQYIAVSDRTVGRILRDADMQPHRQKMYLTSHDDAFRHKRDDVLHVYCDAPADEAESAAADPIGRGRPSNRWSGSAVAVGSRSPVPGDRGLTAGGGKRAVHGDGIVNDFSGGGEIRTHGSLARSPVFKTGALDHSATPPMPISFSKLGLLRDPRLPRPAVRPAVSSAVSLYR